MQHPPRDTGEHPTYIQARTHRHAQKKQTPQNNTFSFNTAKNKNRTWDLGDHE